MGAVQGSWPHRVLVPDVRGEREFLRVTYHEAERLFVVSTWDGAVCTAAVRVSVHAAPELIALLANGLGVAASAPPAAPGRALRPRRLLDRLRERLRTREGGQVLPFRRS
jgi:hypothetical protein